MIRRIGTFLQKILRSAAPVLALLVIIFTGVGSSATVAQDNASSRQKPFKLVADVNNITEDSYLSDLYSAGGKMYFTTILTYKIQREVWVSDGSEEGTEILARFPCGTGYGEDPAQFFAFNGRVYFVGYDFEHGSELWVSDGTPEGTALFADINPGSKGSGLANFTAAAGKMFFTSVDPTGQWKLWASDGTPAGTRLVRSYSVSPPADFVAFHNKLYFVAHTAEEAREIWYSDGTPGGTGVLKEINPSSGSMPAGLTVSGGRLFFRAFVYNYGFELWQSDGNAAGTSLVKDILPGTDPSDPQWLTDVDGTLFFTALDAEGNRGLWRSDGTEDGTQLVRGAADAGMAPLDAGGTITEMRSLKAYRGGLVFVASDPAHGPELWRSDGTPAGTRLLADAEPGAGGIYPEWLTVSGDTLYFASGYPRTAIREYSLWRSDGTPEGTKLVRRFPYYYYGVTLPAWLVDFNGRLFFAGYDLPEGYELWSSDGTPEGTGLFMDLNAHGGGSNPNGGIWYHNRFYFEANDTVHWSELWSSDGTRTGTRMVKDISPEYIGVQNSPKAVFNDWLLFAANDNGNGSGIRHGLELWRTDGTEAGTRIMLDINPGPGWSNPTGFTPFGNRLLFFTTVWTDGFYGKVSLWQTNGEPDGTYPIRSNFSTHADFMGGPLVANGRIFFTLRTSETHTEIWQTGGTGGAGSADDTTSLVASLEHTGPWVRLLYAAGEGVYFYWNAPGQGVELWRIDSRPPFTRRKVAEAADSANGFDTYWTARAQAIGSTLYFVAKHPEQGYALWKLQDGQDDAPELVYPFPYTDDIDIPTTLTAMDGNLYFCAKASNGNRVLWRSEGKADSTYPLLNPGHPYNECYWMQAADDRLYFPTNSAAGQELWTSDGTARGTLMMQDINPGPASSYAEFMGIFGHRMWISADDGVRGREPWVIDLTCLSDFGLAQKYYFIPYIRR